MWGGGEEAPTRGMVRLAPLDNAPALPQDLEASFKAESGIRAEEPAATEPDDTPGRRAAAASGLLQLPASDLSFSSRQQSKTRQTLHMRREQLRRHHLPCWDESDDGVPPFCRGGPPVACWKVFNHQNRCTNHNRCCWVFGNIGWKFFDDRRKIFMAAVMYSTLLSMFITAYGCCALSTDPDIVRATFWASATGYNETSGEHLYDVFFGLRSAVIVERTGIRSLHFGNPPPFDHATSQSGNVLIDEALHECRAAAVGNQVGALMSCVTLIFALIGTMNRMKWSADANVQKTLGMVTDTFGSCSLIYTMINFASHCYAEQEGSLGSVRADYMLGPGWFCYCFCAAVGAIRAVMHWLTPTPGLGAGACKCALPGPLVEAFDVNGDGEFDMDDVLHMLRLSHDAFDMDGDGDVDCDDLRIMCCPCCTGNAVKISVQPGGSHPEHGEHDDPAESAPGGGGGVPPLS